MLPTGLVGALATASVSAAQPLPECLYLPAVNVTSCRIATPPPTAKGVTVRSATYPDDPGNIELAASLSGVSEKARFLVGLTGSIIATQSVTLARADVSCLHPDARAGVRHGGDGIRAEGVSVRLLDVRVQDCGHRGIYLADSSGNHLAEVSVRGTGLFEPDLAASPPRSFPAIELAGVSNSYLLGIGLGSWTSRGSSGSPTAAGIALTGGSVRNLIASAFVAGYPAADLNGVPTGPAILLGEGVRRNQVVRSRSRWGHPNAQRVVCGVDTDDNLWHHNFFESYVPHACPLGDTQLGTGNSQNHGDPEEPDPDDPAQRRYTPRVWTVCTHKSYGGAFCDNRHPGGPPLLGAYVGDLARLVADASVFVSASPYVSRFRPGDLIVVDTFPNGTWRGFTVPDDTELWLVGNTRTQLGTYGYEVFVSSPGTPDIGPAVLADPVAFPVRIQNVTTVGPANAEIITSP